MDKVGREEILLDCRDYCPFVDEDWETRPCGINYFLDVQRTKICRRAINGVMRTIEVSEKARVIHTDSSEYINIYTSSGNGSSDYQDLTKVAEIKNGIIFVEGNK